MGDDVLIPALTFVADAPNVGFNLVGARPILTDVSSLDDWNVSLRRNRAKNNQKNKKQLSLFIMQGYPQRDIVKISKLCKEEAWELAS